MRRLVRLASALAFLVAATPVPAADIVLLVHGGAGALRSESTPERDAAAKAEIERALRAGWTVLKDGGSALDAVTVPVRILEDSPLFNAGKGAVLNNAGQAELDASIMEGHTRRAGAVAGLHTVKNPILLARAVMEQSPHVMMIGDGAEQFARQQGLELVEPSYFIVPERQRQLERAKAREKAKAGAIDPKATKGTVGAVALDRQGRLAAATSTGGMTNKRYGRVGDVPIIGAGTYADAQCAVSSTGWGEFFIRVGVARDICARVAYRGTPIDRAADEVLAEVKALGGDGGVIVLGADGRFALPYNSEGMYRGSIDADGKVTIAIFND
ncbi:MAG: isoaspartyl peptidase/L-asparaginase [Xanthomonadaceae bacterium]|jgi:beta-aspartyl-peptidase (threonine type)|nr:isoaspartyl peptidase/L-asparaginase [Xanthomonadaceae bacterium]